MWPGWGGFGAEVPGWIMYLFEFQDNAVHSLGMNGVVSKSK
jgi:hypothetical protein